MLLVDVWVKFFTVPDTEGLVEALAVFVDDVVADKVAVELLLAVLEAEPVAVQEVNPEREGVTVCDSQEEDVDVFDTVELAEWVPLTVQFVVADPVREGVPELEEEAVQVPLAELVTVPVGDAVLVEDTVDVLEAVVLGDGDVLPLPLEEVGRAGRGTHTNKSIQKYTGGISNPSKQNKNSSKNSSKNKLGESRGASSTLLSGACWGERKVLGSV